MKPHREIIISVFPKLKTFSECKKTANSLVRQINEKIIKNATIPVLTDENIVNNFDLFAAFFAFSLWLYVFLLLSNTLNDL